MNAFCISKNRPRGAILILVLGAVAILSILAVELAHRANLDVARSARATREASFRRDFDSGMEVARALLAEGRKSDGFDTTSDSWSRKIEFSPALNEHITVQLADESGKINILKAAGLDENAIKARKSLARLFAYLRKSEPAREKQWEDVERAVRKRLGIDTSADTSKQAAPVAAATTSDPGLLTLDGLREAGVPVEFVFGGAPIEASRKWALCDVLTTFGDGRINLNTAPAPVLYALDEEYDDALVQSIENWRGRPQDDGQAAGKPLKTARDLELIEGIVQKQTVNGQPQVVKNLFAKIQDRVGVESKCFSARILVEQHGRQRIGWGFMEMSNASAGNNSIPGAVAMQILAFEEIEP
jgi:hypothetical protein